MNSDDISALAARLNADCQNIGRYLLGEPNRRLSSRRELRWGNHGSMRVCGDGARRGKWTDFETDEHGDMLDLIGREYGLDQQGAAAWGAEWLGELTGSHRSQRSDRVVGVATNTGSVPIAREIWRSAVLVKDSVSARYLSAERGLNVPADLLSSGAAIRHHGALLLDGKRVPGMVALMRDPVTGEPVGIQRTFLTPEGRKIERRMLGFAGVVMLSRSVDVEVGLCLGEGMESALAVMTGWGWRPMWAAMSAGAISSFPVLSGVDALSIFSDPGDAGQSAAFACCDRWQAAGRQAINYCPKGGGDWNDVLLRLRAEGRAA